MLTAEQWISVDAERKAANLAIAQAWLSGFLAQDPVPAGIHFLPDLRKRFLDIEPTSDRIVPPSHAGRYLVHAISALGLSTQAVAITGDWSRTNSFHSWCMKHIDPSVFESPIMTTHILGDASDICTFHCVSTDDLLYLKLRIGDHWSP